MVPHGSTALVNPEYMKTAPVSRRHIHVTAAIMYRCVPDRVTVADASTTSYRLCWECNVVVQTSDKPNLIKANMP